MSRRIYDDYGVDEEVEIFSADGSATGRTFLVQLKGTDNKDLGKAFAVVLRAETTAYLGARDLPVLIVRYHAPTEALYARWFHRFDPHYAEREQQSFTFRLTEDDLWTDATPDALAMDVERYRIIRSRRLPLPLQFSLDVASEFSLVSPEALRLEVRSLVAQASDLVRLSDRDAPWGAIAQVKVTEDATYVDFDAGGSVTTHHTFDYSRPEVIRGFANDVVCTLALGIGKLGDVNAAARLMLRFASGSNLISDPEALFRCVGFFTQAHRVVDALRLADALQASDNPEVAVVAPLFRSVALAANGPGMSRQDRGDVLDYLANATEFAERAGDWSEARAAHYMLANFVGPIDQEQALHHYLAAARWDPSYVERPYFLREVAGILFLLGYYENASHLYEEALKREDDEQTRAKYADALMFSGRYEAARQAFEEYLSTADEVEDEFVLKYRGLPLVMTLGGKSQNRDPRKASEVAGRLAMGSVEHSEAAKCAEDALQLDALCGVAWFNLGVAHNGLGENELGGVPFLMAALCQPGDVEAWSNAFVLALAADSGNVPWRIFSVAYRLNEERFIQALINTALEQPPEWPREAFFEQLDRVLGQIPPKRRGFTMRLLDDEGGYETLEITDDPEQGPAAEEP